MPEFFDVFTYDYVKNTDVIVATDAYTTVAELVTPVREEGLYEVGFAATLEQTAGTADSNYLRFSQDGGGSWAEYIIQPSDTQDKLPLAYMFPKPLLQGSQHYIMQAKVVNGASDEMTLHFMNIWMKRVGNTP